MAQLLSELSDSLAASVEAGSQHVVRVDGRRGVPASGIVWSREGLVVTAHHVVERDDSINVGLPDGRNVPGTLVGRDPTTDLAVLSTQAGGLIPPTWGESDDVRVGHLVLALGRPGESVRSTLGIVSALGGSWHSPAGGRMDRYIQTDVVMYLGFSGGPLVDTEGKVLGLNTSAVLRGVSITVPTNTLRRVVEALLDHGRIRRGYLGIGSQPVRLPENLAGQLGQETGLLLVSVVQGSPAEQHGLMLGDIIVSFDQRPIRHISDLQAMLADDRIGSSAPVNIVRGGQLQEVTMSIGEHV